MRTTEQETCRGALATLTLHYLRNAALHFDSATRKTPEWCAWRSMVYRCYLPSNTLYKYYGGWNVQICERWLAGVAGFTNFLSDMGARPTPHRSIDRFPDPYGDYEPNNCRWATPMQQFRN